MIKIIRAEPIDGGQQWVRMTLTVGGEQCAFTHVAPANLSGADLQAYVDGREDFYIREILRNQYPDAPQEVYNGSLEDFESWIAAGCEKQAQAGVDGEGEPVYETVVVEKQPFPSEHPPQKRMIDGGKVSATTRQAFNDATTVTALKKIVGEILFGR